MIASQQSNEEIVKMLLKHNADINKEDKFGKKAHDRATDPNIFYMLQTAAIDQRIKISESKVLSVTDKNNATAQIQMTNNSTKNTRSKEISKSFDQKSVTNDQPQSLISSVGVKPKNDDKKDIMDYYKANFSEQVQKLSAHLTVSVQNRLKATIETELLKSANWLQEILSNDMNLINDKIKEQIDQHICLKIKLASAREGIETPLEEIQPSSKSTENLGNMKFELKNAEIFKENKENTENKDIQFNENKDQNITMTDILAEKDIAKMNSTISKWNKDKKEMYSILKRQMTQYIGKQLDEVAGKVSDGILERLLGNVNKKFSIVQSSLRNEMMKQFMNLTQDLKTRIDNIIKEKMTRVSKRMKDKLNEEKKQIRSESLKMWSEEEKSRLMTNNFNDPVLLMGVKKGVPPLPLSKSRKVRSVSKLLISNQNDNKITALQAAKESPIAQSESTKNMLKRTEKSKEVVKSVLKNEKQYTCMGFRNSKMASSLGQTPRRSSVEPLEKNVLNSQKSPNSVTDKLEMLYKQYANIYQKNSGETKKNAVDAFNPDEMPLARGSVDSGSLGKGSEYETMVRQEVNN